VKPSIPRRRRMAFLLNLKRSHLASLLLPQFCTFLWRPSPRDIETCETDGGTACVCFFLCLFVDTVFSQQTVAGTSFTIARLKYRGGGDWNNDPIEEVDLLTFVKQNANICLNPQYEFAEILSEDFFLYTFKTTRDRLSCEDRTRRSRW
jgi:hypothetical protein